MTKEKAALFKTIDCRNTLGEGAVWDARSREAIWVDIDESLLYRSRFPFDDVARVAAPERIGSYGLLKNRTDQIVAAFESGFAYFSPGTGKADWLDKPALPQGARFNDGRVDRNGVFWAGSMIEDAALRASAGGALFKLGTDLKAKPFVEDVQISNSLCWSPDGKTMYFADSPVQRIWAFDFNDGAPSNRRLFAQTDKGAYPDGSTIDAEGYLWNAQWGAGKVVRYAPDGKVDFVVEVPAPHTSCVAFGGPDLSLLLVTTARAEMSEKALAAAPQSGALFIYETSFKGLPESLCTLPGSDKI